MKLKLLFGFVLGVLFVNCGNTQNRKTKEGAARDSTYIKDFNQYWTTTADYFAYFDTRKTDWDAVRTLYASMIDTVSNKGSFVSLLEKCNNELYNGHIGLNTNTQSSSKLIPTATDLWVRYHNGNFFIESIRANSLIEKNGLEAGMQVLAYNEVAIDQAVEEFLPKSFNAYDAEVYEFAVNTLLAGKHNTERSITVQANDQIQEMALPYSDAQNYYPDGGPLSSKTLEGNFGYIRINNSLGTNSLIGAFDRALDGLMATKGLIIDLRETPSGGNNTIAKAIMGRFIEKEAPYQRYRYVLDEKETGVEQIWTELVIPRKEVYTKPVVLLVGRWTGSMGEGITIGFDSFQRAEIVGTKMAGLLGSIWNYSLNETGIGFQFPGIKLYHIDKTPREQFIPKHGVQTNSDYLKKAMEILDKATGE